MKKAILCIVWVCISAFAYAQNASGLWQGKWSSPEGYVFDFVMHIDEFQDGTIQGYLTWTFIKAPDNDGYYANKKGKEAVEYFKGKIPERGKAEFEGYAKDDPHLIISMDKYQLDFNESFNSFTGKTGHHGAWTGKIEGIRIGLP